MRYAVAFARFWYEFVVGDDWRILAGIAVAIAVTAALAGAGISSWWVVPAAVVVSLYRSLRRVTQLHQSGDQRRSP